MCPSQNTKLNQFCILTWTLQNTELNILYFDLDPAEYRIDENYGVDDRFHAMVDAENTHAVRSRTTWFVQSIEGYVQQGPQIQKSKPSRTKGVHRQKKIQTFWCKGCTPSHVATVDVEPVVQYGGRGTHRQSKWRSPCGGSTRTEASQASQEHEKIQEADSPGISHVSIYPRLRESSVSRSRTYRRQRVPAELPHALATGAQPHHGIRESPRLVAHASHACKWSRQMPALNLDYGSFVLVWRGLYMAQRGERRRSCVKFRNFSAILETLFRGGCQTYRTAAHQAPPNVG